MLKLKLTKHKVITTIILEVLFTIILILLLVSIRDKALGYLHDVQGFAGEISGLEQDLQTQNLTTYDQQQIRLTLDKIDSTLNKGLILIWFILPLSLILLSLIFYYFIWKILSNISIKRFLPSIIPLILLLVTIYFTLNYIAYKFYFVEESPLPQLIIFALLTIIVYYFVLFLLSNNKSFSENLRFAKKNLNKLILPFILNIITNIIYLVTIFIVFFLTYAKASILIPSIFLLVIIMIINIQRIYLVNKISRL